MAKPEIASDVLFVDATISSGNLSRVNLSGGAVTAHYEGTHISIGGPGQSGAVAQRTIASVVNASTVDLTAPVSQAVVDAACVISTDNAPAIQAAIDVGGDPVDIRGCGWFGCSKLDFTGNHKARGLIGDGVPFSGPWLHPLKGGTFLDFGGRSSVYLEGFTFGEDVNGLSNPNVPDCGLLISAPRSVSGGSIDHVYMDRVCGTGHFHRAAFAQRGGSIKADGCAFWNYQNEGYAWAFDSDNALGLTTAAGSLSGVYYCLAIVTGCEAHGLNGGRSTLWRGADGVVWNGGIISGSVAQEGHAWIMGNSEGANGMRRCSFNGVKFESEGGNAKHIFRVESCNAWSASLENFFGAVLPNGDKRTSNIFGCSHDIVTGANPTNVTNFRGCAVGLPRN